MNKSDLVLALARESDLSRKSAERVVDIVFDGMAEAMSRGERVEIRGFGSFVRKAYGAYRGRNPRTGEAIQVSGKHLPVFKAGKELRERVRGAAEPAPAATKGERKGRRPAAK